MIPADPFFDSYEVVKQIGKGSFGDVLLVRRRKSSNYFAAKFLDPTACKHGSQSQELRILQSLDHDCVIRLTDAYKSYSPASSRQCHDLLQPHGYRERLETVLVFPAYDMDLKSLLRLRAACPDDFPDDHRTIICKNIFSGLAYLHGLGILHRDIKPANIFIRYGKTVRAVIGDVGLGKMTASSLDAGGAHTALVCSDGYVAPELLHVRSKHPKKAVYDSPVDVWSAGVILFEVSAMISFLEPGAMTLEGIARRIGLSPPDYGSIGVGAGGLADCLSDHWLQVGRMCLDWLPERRATASVLSLHSALDSGSRLDAVAVCGKSSQVSAPCSASPAAVACVPSTESTTATGHYPSMTDSAVDLGGRDTPQPPLDLHGRICNCRGNCGNKGHKRKLCQAVSLASSSFCDLCSCRWLFCLKPRLWSGFCSAHGRWRKDLSPTWHTVQAAKSLNQLLVPCDVSSFNQFYARHRQCLPSISVVAFAKEPAAVESVENYAFRACMDLQNENEFRACWSEVIRGIGAGEKQRIVELRQLTRSGTGRCSGLGPTMSGIGILQPSPDAGVGDVRLGIKNRTYIFLNEDKVFHEFWETWSHPSWATALAAESFVEFCGSVRTILQHIGTLSSVFGLASEKYCFHFLFRKILIGEARFRQHSTSFAAVDWHALTVGDIKFMSADSNDHLAEFDSTTSAAAVSHFIFGRSDWPLLLSCFACLWNESYAKDGDQSKLAGSESLYLFATTWWQQHGIAPHPSVLLADYRKSLLPNTSRKGKKRAGAEISTSDV